MNFLLSRFYDVLASIYIYNEYTGYTELEKLLGAVIVKFPDEKEFISAVEKHTNDERKHYRMFRDYFEKAGKTPFFVDATYGYIDLFIKLVFKKPIEDLDREEIINNDKQFFKLCRLIMMTEFRGMKQVDKLLKNVLIRKNNSLFKIFKIIERDEPTHCYPYQNWLKKRNSHMPGFEEKFTDLWIHYSILLIKFPILFFNFRLARMNKFYD